MAEGRLHRLRQLFDALSSRAGKAAGSVWAFGIALGVILAWLITGPLFGFSDTWQLLINTGTTIVTFLMVFLLQHTQNRDTRALQLKLDELVKATKGARNRLIDIEELTEEELEALQDQFRRLAEQERGRGGKAEDEAPRDARRAGARGKG